MMATAFLGFVPLVSQAATYTAAQVAQHNTASDCWLIISGNVYDVTNFIPIHPGGNAIVPYCGTDATTIFDSIHGSTGTAANDLPTYLIGSLGIAATSTTSTALTAPSNLVGTPSATSIVLTWVGSVGGVSPVTYAVVSNGISVGTTTATTFTNTGLTPSTTYTYVIQAADSAAPADTASSTPITVTTLATSVKGGGENENEVENEIDDEHEATGTTSTSTNPTGGGGHDDDHGGQTTSGHHGDDSGQTGGSGPVSTSTGSSRHGHEGND